MPINRGMFLQLGFLLLIVPAQYFLTVYYKPPSSAKQSSDVKRMMESLVQWKTMIQKKSTWERWFNDTQEFFSSSFKKVNKFLFEVDKDTSSEETTGTRGPSDDESPAVEVLKLNEKEGHFAGSKKPRSPRPRHVKFRVGQVIRHKLWGYRGVIVGWDETAKAPQQWLDKMHPNDKPHLRLLPNYAVLVDTRDRKVPQHTYVAEENIEIISGIEIKHPEINDYFASFDGSLYIAKPWLKEVYPHDQ